MLDYKSSVHCRYVRVHLCDIRLYNTTLILFLLQLTCTCSVFPVLKVITKLIIVSPLGKEYCQSVLSSGTEHTHTHTHARTQVESIDMARDPFYYISQNLVGKDVVFANADNTSVKGLIVWTLLCCLE